MCLLMRIIYIVVMLSQLFTGCAGKRRGAMRLNIPLDSMINYSNHLTSLLSAGDKTLLFIYDGNCGYCVNKLRECNSLYLANRKDYNQHNCLAILNTRDKYVLEYHLEKLDLTIPVFIDTGSFFLTSNNIKDNNVCFVLDLHNTVVYKGDYLKFYKKFSRVIQAVDEK